jgi:hypothetical protein
MKKQIIAISTHSFIDVITNSSSELFVLGDAKSIEAVKELLQVMLDHWNQMAVQGIFGSHYVTNERYSLASNEKAEYKPIKNWNDTFGNVYIYTEDRYNADMAEMERFNKQYPNRDYEPGWGYEKKENIGKIFIESESDNSIPHEMFEWIESAFGYHTQRYHLG